jgi:hypothetical protein
MHAWERCTLGRDARLREMHAGERCTPEIHVREDAHKEDRHAHKEGKHASMPVREMYLINVRVVCPYFIRISETCNSRRHGFYRPLSHRYASYIGLQRFSLEFYETYNLSLANS